MRANSRSCASLVRDEVLNYLELEMNVSGMQCFEVPLFTPEEFPTLTPPKPPTQRSF